MGAGDEDPNAYKIGYRSPPKEHQFKPGECGRDRGPEPHRPAHRRPRVKVELDDVLRAVGAKKIKVRDGDRVRHASMAEVAVEKFVEGAIRSGRTRDLLAVVQLLAKAGAFGDRPMTQDEMIADLSHEEMANIEGIREQLEKYLPAAAPGGEPEQCGTSLDRSAPDIVPIDLDDVESEQRPPPPPGR